MTRLLPTLLFDIKLQFRYGFFHVGAFMALVSLLILRLFSDENLEIILPALLLESFLITTFYFIAGLFLLEKGEGVLEALVVTPLRTGEYLGSKLIALTLLALAEAFVVVVASYGFGFDFGLFFAGGILLSVFYVLAGFFVIARLRFDYGLSAAVGPLYDSFQSSLDRLLRALAALDLVFRSHAGAIAADESSLPAG